MKSEVLCVTRELYTESSNKISYPGADLGFLRGFTLSFAVGHQVVKGISSGVDHKGLGGHLVLWLTTRWGKV